MSASAETDKSLRLAWLGSRLLTDGQLAFVGIGVPSLAAMLAKRTTAPGLRLIYESGVIGANPTEPPLSTGSPSVARGADMIGSMLDVFAMLQAGRIDVGLLSAAQVDRRGNLNATVIGDYGAPKLRLPGSGGAHDIAALASSLVIMMPHEPRRFVERVDFITSPGFLGDRGERDELGLPGGPRHLVTDRAIFDFDGEEMTLRALHEGFSADDAVAGFPWQPPRHPEIECIAAADPRSLAELKALVGDSQQQ